MKKFSLEAKPWLCFLFLAGFSVATLNAQHILSGTVTEENGEPLPYAIVHDSGNINQLDSTDFDGKFSIETSYLIDSITVNYIGVEPQTVKAVYGGEMNVTFNFMPFDSIKIVQGGRGVVSPFIQPMPIVPLPTARVVSRRFMQNPMGSSVFPISQFGAKEINSTNGFSMHDALNMIPGVQMDSRGYNGSRRLNLRGTIARSPFGVRNVRLNLSGFPLTSADGSSAMELLEPSEISAVNVYKGPSGSYNMTGTGGVISASLLPLYGIRTGGELTYGQYGFLWAKAASNFSIGNVKSRVSVVHSSNEGYRAQEANNKTQLTLESRFSPKNNFKLNYNSLLVLYDGYWELPGHITAEQAELDPTQADPDSEDMNAHVHRRRAYFGVNQDWRINNRLSNSTKLFGQLSDKENPYGTHPVFFQGYKEEVSREIGLRTEFDAVLLGSSWSPKLSLKSGTQWQIFNTDIDEFDNLSGVKGSLKYSNQTGIVEGLVFSSLEYKPNSKLKASAQLGYSYYSLNNDGTNADDTSLNFNSESIGKLLPRIGVNYSYAQQSQVGASYSEGLGYPAIFEWVDTESGLFSPSLLPEESSNVEVFVTRKIYKSNYELDLKISGYTGKVKNTILENSDVNQAIFYTNSGESLQNGIEFQGAYSRIVNNENTWSVFATAALQDYRFKNDTSDQVLNVPGIPQITSVIGVNYGVKAWAGNVSARYVSEIPLAVGADTEPGSDYLLVNAKVGRLFDAGTRWNYSVEIGVNNALNQTYTSFFRLNAAGRVYNPMPGINGFISVKVNFR